MQTILVTGASGTIGSNVVSELVKNKSVKVRFATRGGKGAPAGTEAIDFDWDDAAKVAAAVKGVDAVFLLTPFVDNAVPMARRLVDAAKAAGVKKIVKLSAAGVDTAPFQFAKWHREIELMVEGSGMKYVLLRPNFFMTNFVGYYPPDAEGAIYMPTGNGKAAWMDPRDIAEVAAITLVKPDWDNRALYLTGGEALSVADVAKLISDATGRTVRHVDVPESAARSAMEGMKLPEWMIQGMLDLHTVLKNDWAAATSDEVKNVTGHAPRTFSAFVKENANAWKK
jgi:uncharacterized protein YbjT (DUF2867 family)